MEPDLIVAPDASVGPKRLAGPALLVVEIVSPGSRLNDTITKRPVRTTVNIDDRLLHHARELATRTRRPLGAIVDDALRMLLSRVDQPDRGGAVDLTVYGGSGLRPGVDLEDKEALATLLETNDGDELAAG